jgi:hypothetical protein
MKEFQLQQSWTLIPTELERREMLWDEPDHQSTTQQEEQVMPIPAIGIDGAKCLESKMMPALMRGRTITNKRG